jgi:hypothetical protein
LDAAPTTPRAGRSNWTKAASFADKDDTRTMQASGVVGAASASGMAREVDTCGTNSKPVSIPPSTGGSGAKGARRLPFAIVATSFTDLCGTCKLTEARKIEKRHSKDGNQRTKTHEEYLTYREERFHVVTFFGLLSGKQEESALL